MDHPFFKAECLSAYQPGEYARSLFFNERTMETLCMAVIKAEDAVITTDASGKASPNPTSILTEEEKEEMFGTVSFLMLAYQMAGLNLTDTYIQVHSPFYAPLVGVGNVVIEHAQNQAADSFIFQPLRKNWSRMMHHVGSVLMRFHSI